MRIVASKTYCFDFECTSREPATPYICSFARLSQLQYDKVKSITSMKGVIDYIFTRSDESVFYAHNLKYDISFILCYLFQHHKGEFDIGRSIIMPMTKSFITIDITFNNRTITFRDSLALFSAPLSAVMKSYTQYEKGETPLFDYIEDVVIDEYVLKYSKMDVLGLGEALIKRLEFGKQSVTTASDAFKMFKSFVNKKGKSLFTQLYTPLSVEFEENLRKAYRGGFTFLNPIHANKILENIKVIDVNSMYPAQMYNNPLPYSTPKIVECGEVVVDDLYSLGVQKFSIKSCYLKDGFIPFLSNSNAFMGSNVYKREILEDEKEENRTFYLTLQEFELFKKSYFYEDLKLLGGFLFKARNDMFKDYINHYWKMKSSKDLTIKALGKLFLNALYGKFAEGYEKSSFNIEYDNKIIFSESNREVKECGYLPVGVFITSYARVFLIESILKIGANDFIYCDTDSIHYLHNDNENKLEYDNEKLGYWSKENEFTRAFYIRSKRYCGEYIKDGKVMLKRVAAGIKNRDLIEQIPTLEDFKVGKEIKTIEFKQGVNGQFVRDKTIKI